MSETAKSSKAATLAAGAGIGAPAVTLIGIALVQLGAAPMVGFRLFTFGILLGLVAVLVGGFGLYATRGGVAGRSKALTGLGLGLLMVVIVVLGALPGAGVPPINDITTNLADPPGFAPAAEGHPNHGRDMSYPPGFVAQVEQAYADLVPIALAEAPDEAYRRAVAAAQALGWEVTRQDITAGTFEATEATAVWRFVDDVSVRVQPGPMGGATVDIRSKSRDGRGDLGANAARIRAFRTELAGS